MNATVIKVVGVPKETQDSIHFREFLNRDNILQCMSVDKGTDKQRDRDRQTGRLDRLVDVYLLVGGRSPWLAASVVQR